MLHQLTVESRDPSKEEWRQKAGGGTLYWGGDMHTHGINTTRGRAAFAVRDLILADACNIDRFRPTLQRMVRDQSPAVLSCVSDALNAVAHNDTLLGFSLFRRMDLSEDRLFATRPVALFLRHRLHDSFAEVLPLIERMLRSNVSEVRQAGATLAGLAVLTRKEAEHLVDEALCGSSHHRFGLAQVAAANVADPVFRVWCEGMLPTLFNDDDGDVRREAATCFRQLEGAALETYVDLIRAFGESRAFHEHAYSLLRALDRSLERLPGLTCEICAKLASRPETQLKGVDVRTLGRLIFRVYQQHRDDEWTSRALDLIDLLCLNGSPDVAQELEDFER